MQSKLDNYKIFIKVFECLNFSKAASSLYMTQPAISQSIKQLETHLNIRLFVRNSTGVVPTKESTVLYEYVSNAMGLIKSGEDAISKINNLESGTLNIGVSETITKYLLMETLEEFLTLYPNIKLKILNRTSSEVIELLKANEIDLGIINGDIEDTKITSNKFYSINDVFIAGSKFHYLKNKKISMDEIIDLPLVFLEKNTKSREFVETLFEKQNKFITPEIELGSHDLLIDFVKNNIGVACVCHEFAKNYIDNKNGIFKINTSFKIESRNIYICHLKNKSKTPSVIKFKEMLLKRSNIKGKIK